MQEPAVYKFPIQFRDVHYIAALYRSNQEAVIEKLKGTGLKPALHFMGSPLTAVGLIQYKDSDLGAYNELIIAIPVVPENTKHKLSNWLDLYSPLEKREIGQFIIHIPVTTQRSVDAGRELWGYPKIVLPITHEFGKKKLHTQVMSASGQTTLIEINGSNGWGVPIPSMDLMTYSMLHDEMLKTFVDVDANMKWMPFSNLSITVLDKNDEMCKDIVALNIYNKKPVFTIEPTQFKANFFEGRKMH